MFRLWCFCGWGKIKNDPIPARCPRCGKKLHITSLNIKQINKKIMHIFPKNGEVITFLDRPIDIFLTGGVGDIFALDFYLTDEIKKHIRTIYYATRAADVLIKLFDKNLKYKLLKTQKKLFTDFSDIYCFVSFKHYYSYLVNNTLFIPDYLSKIFDYSIFGIVPIVADAVNKNNKVFINNTSSFLDAITTPYRDDFYNGYIFIHPGSANSDRNDKHFNEKDWRFVLKYLDKTGLKGIVINNTHLYSKSNLNGAYKKEYKLLPRSNSLLDFTNKTTMHESLQLLKYASGFIGVESCFSVLAVKLFDKKDTYIKRSVAIKDINLFNYYYYPHSGKELI